MMNMLTFSRFCILLWVCMAWTGIQATGAGKAAFADGNLRPLSLENEGEVSGDTVYSLLHDYNLPITYGDMRYYTRMGTDCGQFGGGPGYEVSVESEALRLRAWNVGSATSYVGFWHSLSGLAKETGYALDLARPLPYPIKARYQPQVTGARLSVKGSGTWRVELKSKTEASETEVKRYEFYGYDRLDHLGYEIIDLDFSGITEPVKLLNIVVENGGNLFINSLELAVTLPEGLGELDYAFLVSLAQLLRCYDPETGMVRDRSNWPAKGITAYNVTPGLGWVAMAVACAAKCGFVETADALEVSEKVIARLLDLPAHESGWLPHYTTFDCNGDPIPHPNSTDRYSTVDTALAYLSAYAAAAVLEMEDEKEAILSKIKALDFGAVTNAVGEIHHGFDQHDTLLPSVWTDFGGETLLLLLLGKINDISKEYTCKRTPMPDTIVYKGVGFILEMAALFSSKFGANPVAGPDAWCVDWYALRNQLFDAQQATVGAEYFYGGRSSCEIVCEDGTTHYLVEGAYDYATNWLAPHYAALTTSLHLETANALIHASREAGYMPPLSGPVESILFDDTWSPIPIRIHYLQSAINAWFNTLGYYATRCLETGETNAILDAMATDPATGPAIDSLFGDPCTEVTAPGLSSPSLPSPRRTAGDPCAAALEEGEGEGEAPLEGEGAVEAWFNFKEGSGANLPWINYGWDLGRNPYGEEPGGFHTTTEDLETYFQFLAQSCVSLARVFLFCDLRTGIYKVEDGPYAFDEYVYSDMDALIAAAAKHNLKLLPVLLDYTIADGVVMEGESEVGEAPEALTEHRESLICLLESFVAHYAQEPVIFGWDIFNEPEFIQEELVDAEAVRSFARILAGLIRSAGGQPVTVGLWSCQSLEAWKDVGLDFYQIHYYDDDEGMSAACPLTTPAAFYDLDAPLLFGEMKSTNATDKLTSLKNLGYAGVSFWSLTSPDPEGYMFTDVVTEYAAFFECFHPADTDKNNRIIMSEAIAYLAGWQQGSNPIAYAIRAAYLWQNGEYYRHDPDQECPLCWVSDAL